jgi:hypothetical protein
LLFFTPPYPALLSSKVFFFKGLNNQNQLRRCVMNKREIETVEKEYDALLEKNFVEKLKIKKKKLSEDELRKVVRAFLEENTICTLATCSNNVPRSTPVRYRSKDFTIYVLAEGGMKIKNMRENPLVSVSIYGDYSGFQSVRGLQMWGKAEIINPDAGERYLEANRIVNLEGRKDLKGLGIENIKHNMKAIKITIERARYLSIPDGVFNQILSITDTKQKK